MDIGASKTVLRSLSGDMAKEDVRVTYGHAETVDTILECIREQLQKLVARDGCFERIAISSAPTLGETGVVERWPNRPDWKGADIGSVVAPFAQGKILWCDDGVAGTLADALSNPEQNLLHLVLGSGVGGSVWFNGSVLSNPEFGHVVVNPNGNTCVCGKRGCLQAYVGGRALDAAQSEVTNFDNDQWLEQAAAALGQFGADMTSQFNLDKISLSGGLLKRFPGLLDLAQLKMDKISECRTRRMKISLSPWGANAPIKGAELLANLSLIDRDARIYAVQLIAV